MTNCDHKDLDAMFSGGKLLFFVCQECEKSLEVEYVLGFWKNSENIVNLLRCQLAEAAEEIARLKIKNATLQAENNITSRIR